MLIGAHSSEANQEDKIDQMNIFRKSLDTEKHEKF